MNLDMDEQRCYFDISIDGKETGRIVFKLYNKIVPRTCYNFMQLCEGSDKVGKITGKKLCYQGSTIHRVVKDFMIQGGDFSHNDGTGGESYYDGTFEDENFDIKHDKPFILSMANRGPNTNGSQFFITTQPFPKGDGNHVAFGEVIDGFNVVRCIEQLKVGNNDRPKADVVITKCGRLVLVEKEKRDKHHSKGEEKGVKRSEKKESKSEKNQFFSSIKPEDLPELPPTRNFLDRGSPRRDNERSERLSRNSSSRPYYNYGGVTVKGRGTPRYRTDDSVPQHIRYEEDRKISLEDAQKKKETEIVRKRTFNSRRSPSPSNRKREISSNPATNIPIVNSESDEDEPMEIDASNIVAEHIRSPHFNIQRNASNPRPEPIKRQRADDHGNSKMIFKRRNPDDFSSPEMKPRRRHKSKKDSMERSPIHKLATTSVSGTPPVSGMMKSRRDKRETRNYHRAGKTRHRYEYRQNSHSPLKSSRSPSPKRL
uniref:PPIase cyclophilin-type domain-containing protein n=1 Tax=Panagrolaimus sp. ES5 TaxID=591445 RepID=A0AC34FGC0_9BILA